MPGPTPWSLDEQIAEVRRELAVRKNIYPKMVKRGTIKQDKAEICYSRLRSVDKTLNDLGQFGRVILAEFDGSGPPLRVKIEREGKSYWYGVEGPGS